MNWLRKAIDDLRYQVWTRHQNGNAQLQEMLGNTIYLAEELHAAKGAVKDGHLMEALQLIEMALTTVREQQATLREQL